MAAIHGTPATTSNWVAGTSMIAVALLAGGWFLAISPTLGEASDTRAETTSVRDRNAMLEAQLAVLAQQNEGLPALRAELATLRSQLPSDADLAPFLDELAALSQTHGVTLLGVTPGTPVAVTPSATTATGPAGPAGAAGEVTGELTGEVAGGAVAGTDPALDPAAAAAVATATAPTATPIEGFVAVPVELTALGGTGDVLGFLEALQTQSTRLFLVTGLGGSGQGEAEAAGARPATRDGDVEMRIAGFVYVLADDVTTAAAAAGAAGAIPAAPGTAELPSASSPTFSAG